MPERTREVVVTYLEMHEPPPPETARSAPEHVVVVEAERPTVAFYRFLYNTVGAPWHWVDRRQLSDAELREIIHDPEVHVHVLYHRGTPAGYAELDRRTLGDVEVAYFGLMPAFIGEGLGSFFLDWTIREAWRPQPERVWVHTCTLDHPRALGLYKKVGFIPYKEEREQASLLAS